MNTQILCIGGSAARWQSWGIDLEADGYVVVHASDEMETVQILGVAPVDVVCIDSQAMAGTGSFAIGANLKNSNPHVPVVLIQSDNNVSPQFEKHVDVAIDEPTVAAIGHWLIEELREASFPVFVGWTEEWRQRRLGEDKEGALPA